jgi:Domain of unknown function (DUF4157)
MTDREHVAAGARLSASASARPRHRGDQSALVGLQRAAGNRAVQRLVSGTQDELDGAAVSARIGAAEARGRGLDPSVQARVAEELGADPGPVRVHADAEADELSRALGAKAFTSGRDVFFGNGTFDPSSPEGFALLVHESTHVLQQAAGPVPGTATPDGALAISDPGDSHERVASSAAEGVAAAAPSGDARSVQRDEGGARPSDAPNPWLE